MDSLDLIQTFREVARRGSFSGAARALGMSPANVSKYIAQLEARFGLRLFHRTTRKVTLTEAGELLFERSGALLELIDFTEGEMHERATRPVGRLALTVPHALMASELPALLGRFMQRYPEVTLHLHVTNRLVNLVDEGVDLAFRIGPILQPNLIVRRLLRLDHVAAATPDYWDRRGRPAHPSELLEHDQLAFALPGEAPVWQFQDRGKPLELRLTPRFTATDPAPLRTWALQGLGVVWGTVHWLADALASGTLEPLLHDYSPPEIWLYVAYMQRRHSSAALRALLDYLNAHFQPPPMPALPAAGRKRARARAAPSPDGQG